MLDEVGAAEALAESYFRSGKVEEAMAQLERVKAREDLDYYQRSRVTARLEEMRLIMADFDEPQTG